MNLYELAIRQIKAGTPVQDSHQQVRLDVVLMKIKVRLLKPLVVGFRFSKKSGMRSETL